MTPATEIRRRAMSTTGYAYALIEQLSPEKLTAVVQLLEFLSEPLGQTVSTPQEVALLEVIQRRFQHDQQQRLEELRVSEAFRRNRCEWGELTDIEHEELIQYEDLPGILLRVSTPAKPPKPSGKSPGWKTGQPHASRIRYPIVKKRTSYSRKAEPKPA